MTDQPFHEPTFLAALDRAEAIIARHEQYKLDIRRSAMRDLYASVAMVTDHNPLDQEINRLTDKLDKILVLEDQGKAVSVWDSTHNRYKRMCDYQLRVQEVMRKDREL